MPNDITIPNPLPAAIVALSGAILAQVDTLTLRAKGIRAIESVEQMSAADALVADAIALDKAIEAERKRIKAPIAELTRALDDAAAEARTPLIGIKADLGSLIVAFQRAENARREAERQRIEAEQAAARAAAAAAAEAQRQAEAARAAAAADQDVPPGLDSDEPPAATVIIPEVIPPSYEQQQAMAPLKSSAVVSRTVKVVEIFDPVAVPNELNGVALRVLDVKQIEKLAKAGLPIPGVRVVERATIAAKG
jgi:hypothetical protein